VILTAVRPKLTGYTAALAAVAVRICPARALPQLESETEPLPTNAVSAA
jgi:hypothetical protein